MNSSSVGFRSLASLSMALSNFSAIRAHAVLSPPSARRQMPRCLYACQYLMYGTLEPCAVRRPGSPTSCALPPSQRTPVTTVFVSALIPSLHPAITSHVRHISHAAVSWLRDAKSPTQSSAKATWQTLRHASSRSATPYPHSLTPFETAVIATTTVFSRILALSGLSTQPIRSPM